MQLDYYGFSDKPFELSPDLRFLYLTPSYRQALETVWKGVIERKGLIILTGEVGTGKTMLIHSIISRLPAQIRTAFIFHSTYNFKEMLEQIVSELGEPPTSEWVDGFKISIPGYLKKLRERGETLAVFIDEAQKLSEEALRGLLDLLDLEPWISEILQLVLVGQTEFEEIIDAATSRYRARISPLRVRIDVLSRKESLDYIEHRMRTVGRSSAEIFSTKALSLITEYSKGIPRLINIVCDNALFNGYNESLKIIEPDTVRKVIGNLEGPEKESKVRRKSPKQALPSQSRYHLSVKQKLPILVGLACGVVIFLWHTDYPDFLTDLRMPGFVKTLMDRLQNPAQDIKPQKETPKNTAGSSSIPVNVPKPTPQKTPETQNTPIEPPSMRRIQVTDGETLSRLALQYYGKFNESLIDLILFYNPGIKNINLILVDQKIQLPELSEAALIVENADKQYSIHLGTFHDSGKVKEFNNQPALKGKKITIQPKKITFNQSWYRVEAGMFESKPEALEVIKTLQGKGLLPFF